jgi:hypothetical protein
VLGSRQNAFPRWLVPQLFAAARVDRPADLLAAGGITLHALGWAVITLTAYAALRSTRG